MTKQVSVTREVAATPEQVFAMVSELTRMGEWSPEATGGKWLGGATGPAVGAKFKGTNRNGSKSWSTVAIVKECTPGKAFAFDVKVMGMNVATWRYDIEPSSAGSKVTETWIDARGGLIVFAGKVATGVSDRDAHNRATMEQTLANLATAVAT